VWESKRATWTREAEEKDQVNEAFRCWCAIKAVVMFGRLVKLLDTVMGTLQLAGPMSDDELSALCRGAPQTRHAAR
jgi:hypothetical protein